LYYTYIIKKSSKGILNYFIYILTPWSRVLLEKLTSIGDRNGVYIQVFEPEENRPLGRSRHRW
jgi:hypothetical protein